LLRTRVLTALVAIPLALLAVYSGGWPFALVVAALAFLSALELKRLAEAGGLTWVCPAGLVGAPLVVLAAMPALSGSAEVAILTVLASLIWALFRQDSAAQAAQGAISAIFTVIYVGALPAYFVRLREFPQGESPWLPGVPAGIVWTLFALVVTWCCDSAAYFGGRAFGRRPFFKAISPKKTAEGAVAGLVGAALVGVLAAPLLGLHWAAGLSLGTVCGVACEAGDLAESLLKRAAGAKDSGTLFPGHGGVLDRIDSLLFVVVIAWFGSQLARTLG
jgi:phosphatidate cytidylyltransferase